MLKMTEIDLRDRPREKLLEKGVSALTNAELLQVIIGSGVQGADVVKISHELLKQLELCNGSLSLEDVTKIKCISTATATKLLASLEVASRFVKSGIKINTIDNAAGILTDIRTKKQEHFVLLTLDGADRLINRHVISIGTVNASLIHPRDVFSQAIADNAASIIVAHNHPGGSLTPTSADIEVTVRLEKAGKLIGIALRSHLIITIGGAAAVQG